VRATFEYIVSLDLIGFGDSEKPSDFSYLMEDQVRILEKVISLLDIDRARKMDLR
jgi:hypothetical protein